jgi:hypothetical protein
MRVTIAVIRNYRNYRFRPLNLRYTEHRLRRFVRRNLIHNTDLLQGRVRVVLSPSRYEIPSGSTYGYLIADNADQVSTNAAIMLSDYLITPPTPVKSAVCNEV